MKTSLLLFAVLTGALLACRAMPVGAADDAPFSDAVAVWHMSDPNDSAGKNSSLTSHGEVRVGVALGGAEREASLGRGGDGVVAEFQGGYLCAGQGDAGELNLTGKAMSMCLRFRVAEGLVDTPLFSKHGGHPSLVYNLFWTPLDSRTSLGFELGTDWNERPLQLSVPAALIGPSQWHDAVVRFDNAKVELFVDGSLVDEDWPIGALRQGNTEPCLIGAESHEGGIKAKFRGQIDHAALWNRALSDGEIVALSGGPRQVAQREQQILGKPDPHMQYWRPRGHNTNVGDCMPFLHEGRFHLFYLFDRRHHRSKWGLGAHQWAHCSTTDLVHWEHHPLAIPITEQGEASICTGSTFYHDGTYYGFYATRKPDRTQHLNLAVSTDGIHFQKTPPDPLASPQAGYDPRHYRDPKVFQDQSTGLFHMLVTARLTDDRGGCIAQLVSKDLKTWELAEPFLIPGRVTDCPDYFEWNGWYYLLAEYVYWMSRGPLGPWTQPTPDRLDVLYVPKTAAFTGGRRIYASWLPDGGWGGNLVFRELLQHGDGTLGTKFPAEMIPAAGDPLELAIEPLTDGVSVEGNTVRIRAGEGFRAAALSGAPQNMRISLRVRPEPAASHFGLCVKGVGRYEQGCELRFEPARQRVQFGAAKAGGMGDDSPRAIRHVAGLDRPFTVDIIVKDDIIDACLDHRRTIIHRHQGDGDRIFLFGQDAEVVFESVEVRPLTGGRDPCRATAGKSSGDY
jgi:hypothetical protein